MKIFFRQVHALTKANLKTRYRRTFAGFLWVVLNPILMFGVQSLIFKRVLNIPVDHYLIFLLSGLLPWIFITQSMDMCTSLFLSNGQVLKSFHLNPMVLLIAQLVDNLINFLAAFVLIFVALLLGLQSGLKLSPEGLLAAPLAVAVLLAGVSGLCWILATTQVFLRDTRFIVQFGMAIMFFLTPIFYPADMVPTEIRWLADYNVFYRLIEPFRISMYHFEWEAFAQSLLKGAALAAGILVLAALHWQHRRRALYVHL